MSDLEPAPLELRHPNGRIVSARGFDGGRTGWIVIGGATATPQTFYAPFAAWLANRLKARVLTFDYRGIGASKTMALRDDETDCRGWADDLALAVEHAGSLGPTVVVGHSFGGHGFGMTDAHKRTLGLYAVGVGAGWYGHMAPVEAAKVWAIWNVVAPPLVALRGYAPMSALGIGEDLPRGVYRDWKRWCRRPRYFFDDPDAEFTTRFSEIRVPVVGVNSVDDPWAPPRSAEAFLSHYPNLERITVEPASFGLSSIGHMGYVRPSRSALWTHLAEWCGARISGR